LSSHRWGKRKIVFTLTLAAILAFLFWGDSLWHSLSLRREINRTQMRLDSLRDANKTLEARITKLKKGDRATLEEEARSQGLVYEDERITHIVSKSELRKKK